jgi:hypothetical protein
VYWPSLGRCFGSYDSSGYLDLLKHHYIALAVLLIFAREVARANPPEYLAASREPAENTSEEVSPIEEPSLELSGWRLAMHSTEPFFRDSIFSH